MKKKLLYGLGTACLAGMLLLAQPLTSEAAGKDVTISESTFPDANFRSYVKKEYDSNKDGKLSSGEISAATEIFIVGGGIKNVKGVEYFTELTTFHCERNELTSLDLSKNTKLTNVGIRVNKKLTKLDISKNKELKSLDCGNCGLTYLDVSKNTKLESLWCNALPIKKLDLSKNTALTSMKCCECDLTALDVSKCTKLNYLDCTSNELTALDVTKNPELEMLFCDDNKLTTLDLSKNTKLKSLRSFSNSIKTLDISNNSGLLQAYTTLSEKDSKRAFYSGENNEELSVSPDTTIKGAKKKWVKNSKKWFYYNEKGKLQTGWKKVDGTWYYFDKTTHVMAANEWIGGYWLSGSGAWKYKPRARWRKNSRGWWYEDTSGWYPKNKKQKIDGKVYSFDAKGYMK